MFKQVITGILAAVAAIAVLAWSRRGERPIVMIPDPSLAPSSPLATTSWPPLAPASMPTTRPGIPWDRRVAELKFNKVTLEQAAARLSAATGVNIVVSIRSVESLGVDRQQTLSLDLKDVSLRAALRLILREATAGSGAELGWTVEENVIFVGDAGPAPAGVVTRVYNVRDLVVDALRYSKGLEPLTLASAPSTQATAAMIPVAGRTEAEVAEAIRQLIVMNVEPNHWADNGSAYGQASYFAGLMVVDHLPEAHAKIEALLAALRRRP
jgi:hypothetical protein